MTGNKLYYGDNLEVLRGSIKDESVDLVYLDPPFNSARNYNVIFSRNASAKGSTADASAQIEAFEDTWTWTPETERQFDEYVNGGLPSKVADVLSAMRMLLGENDASAYLINMAPRLVELHRVLKPTGSFYLHCDPTMSHYLKVLLDGIFDARNFKNEISWKRTSAHSASKKYGPIHDTILFYTKSPQFTWNDPRTDYDEAYLEKYYRYDDGDGRLYWRNSLTAAGTRNGSSGQPWRGYDVAASGQHWKFAVENLEALDAAGKIYWPPKGGMPQIKRYKDELKGVAVGDIWTDIDRINQVAAERLGYPTQKPLALMNRIIAASSNPGDVVLDPFCGCGTTVDAAQQLERSWIGIDITYIAVDLIEKRLLNTYGPSITSEYVVSGIPHDKQAAFALFKKNPFDFERWAVSMVGAQPNAKQVGDKGIDGIAKFPLGGKGAVGRVIVSVKGGKNLNPAMVRDLLGTVQTQKAEMGVLIVMGDVTKGLVDAVNHAGNYKHPANGDVFPKLQIITVPQLLNGTRPKMPPTYTPYILAQKTIVDTSSALF
ncbi:restriction endonuclease [Rathayibacter festucae]|uniref:DNA methyltransferase n=1 Tax=Rathayibacter festucae TaxID=110937 RepID=UPI001FB328D4|nr:DNA methyltransferase [Rathayibacter festucae]MCJ1699939.1 restriction endonuclease [Rathayibacter festucae]